METQKVYEKVWFIILMFFVFAPIGIYLMWKYTDWGKFPKIILSVFFGIAFIVAWCNTLIGDDNKNAELDNNNSVVEEQQIDSEEIQQEEEEEPQKVEEKKSEDNELTEKQKKQIEQQESMDSWTGEQKNCYESARNYLSFMAFSKQGLIDQLSSDYGDKYPVDVAEFAVSKLEEFGNVDWDEQCEKSAQAYLDTMSFSKQELIEQLCSDYGDKYTREQAEKAVEKVYN